MVLSTVFITIRHIYSCAHSWMQFIYFKNQVWDHVLSVIFLMCVLDRLVAVQVLRPPPPPIQFTCVYGFIYSSKRYYHCWGCLLGVYRIQSCEYIALIFLAPQVFLFHNQQPFCLELFCTKNPTWTVYSLSVRIPVSTTYSFFQFCQLLQRYINNTDIDSLLLYIKKGRS